MGGIRYSAESVYLPLYGSGKVSGAICHALDSADTLYSQTRSAGRILPGSFGDAIAAVDNLNSAMSGCNNFMRALAFVYNSGRSNPSIHSVACAMIAAKYRSQFGGHEMLVPAAFMHDIGKALLPEKLLNCPDRLSYSEQEDMRTHPILGYDLLIDLNHSMPLATAALEHHVQVSGYPVLHHEPCSLANKVSAIDELSACMEDRSYRGKWPLSESLRNLQKEAQQGRRDYATVDRLDKIMHNTVLLGGVH